MPCERTQQSFAASTLVIPLAGVGWHLLYRRSIANRARDRTFEDYDFAHFLTVVG